MKINAFYVFLSLFSILSARTQTPLQVLTTEYLETPLGIDIKTPRFSWQMETNPSKIGQFQTAYQILVFNESNIQVWDSGKIVSGNALAISYDGQELEPQTRYTWEVKVWDEEGKISTKRSWFETGLLDANPNSKQWNSAQWIGGGDADMVLNSQYLSVYKMEYSLQLDSKSKSTRASFVFGANDVRLMDKNKNIQGVANGRDENYVRFELDIAKVDGSENGLAQFNVFRLGYDSEDSSTVPFRSFKVPLELINNQNKFDEHTFYTDCNFGLFEVFLDGRAKKNKISGDDDSTPPPRGNPGFNLNPVGKGNNYISFPMVADIGFYVDKGQKAIFSDVKIKNFRKPSNVLFQEDLQSDAYDGIFQSKTTSISNFNITNNGYEISAEKEPIFVIADPSRNAAPVLRTEFSCEEKKISKARIYVTARGIYELYLNGKRVGEDYFNPGLTQYNKTQMYQTYDVTNEITSGGENTFGAILSEGWWSGNITYSGENWNYFGDRQSLLAELVITYDDGAEQVVTTNDKEWKLFADGPIRYGSFFQGEVYDAQKEAEITGWSSIGFKDENWKSAISVSLEGTTYQTKDFNYEELQLIGQIGENPSIVKKLTPVNVEEVRPGVFVYDMNQNMVGFPEIQLPPGQAGDTITLRYAEVKYPDLSEYEKNTGMVMLENIRAALTQDMYIRKGGEEIIRPRFTFHGYRFLEITGINEPLPLENVKGLVVSSIKELASSYETSNELVNKLWENITWSLRGNFLSIPTDTPARNERMGWSGDINVFSEAATYLADIEPFLDRHLLAMRDIQRKDGRFTDVAPVGGGFGGTLWGSAGIIIAWELYQQYDDLTVLEEHYEAMKQYVEFLNSKIDSESGILNEGPLGDWLSPEGFKNEDTMLWAVYHLRDLEILTHTAELLNKPEDAENFRKQYQERKAFLNSAYIDSATGKTLHLGNQSTRFGPPLPEEMYKKAGDFVDTQASYAIPLNFNVLDEKNKEKVVNNLVTTIKRTNMDELGVERPAYSLMTGFIGTASLNHALSENGKDEMAYKLLQQTTYPSWLYSVKNGATTIWERLNSYTVEDGFGGNNSMNSFNHYSFGAVAAWMYNYSLGIQRDPEHPGFKHFVLEPTPDPTKEMKFAKGYYDSMYGRIASKWNWVDDGWIYSVTVPANTTATLKLNTDDVKKIMVDDKKLKKAKGVSWINNEADKINLELVSGRYSFRIRN
ncbi:alpha-L-rhamnosidase [Maribacter caenipelagi]|uniref:alpha-L-rhamnosidase n=1 Tax=Maribacter caenipelagi TaxID=1447781 RepID=A0A4R7D090_9FLAO|nr:alpha-L-rhamnosidase [Maribacter caenipelagi]TDS14343.1 alpha-L-rhamnosidase [Maribacter caenipelagi]